MDKIKVAKDFVLATLFDSDTNEILNSAFRRMNRDTFVFGNESPSNQYYRRLVKEIIGDDAFFWLEWFMYDTEFGDKKMECSFFTGDPLRSYSMSDLDLFLSKVFDGQTNSN